MSENFSPDTSGSEYELKVAQAKANYQKAVMENTARETAISTTANNLTVSDANIEELRIRLDQTHNDFLRYEQLYGQKAVTRQQYDNAKADYEATKAKYDMLVRSKRSTALMKDEQTRRLEQNQTNIDVAPQNSTWRNSISHIRLSWPRAMA